MCLCGNVEAFEIIINAIKAKWLQSMCFYKLKACRSRSRASFPFFSTKLANIVHQHIWYCATSLPPRQQYSYIMHISHQANATEHPPNEVCTVLYCMDDKNE